MILKQASLNSRKPVYNFIINPTVNMVSIIAKKL